MVKLWDVEKLIDETAGADDSLLATLEHHTQSVNVVRWSADGSLLASGSDDKSIIIYAHTPGVDPAMSQMFGSKAVASKVRVDVLYVL
jgi:WD40 repeat protein